MKRLFGQPILAALLLFLTMTGFLLHKNRFDFFDDDYGAFYSGRNFQFSDIKEYFNGNKLNDLTILPSNLQPIDKSFFGVTYRPATLLFYALECAIFNAQENFHAWPYFVVSVFLHALAVVLIFLAMSFFVSWLLAFLAAICFAFYPFMGIFIGRFSIQPFSLCLIFGLLCVGLFYRFSKTGNYLSLFLSSISFAIPLFMHEIVIGLPLWLFLLAFYEFSSVDKSKFRSGIKAFASTFPFFLIVMIYLGLRVWFFPPIFVTGLIFNPILVFTKLKIRFYDFVTLAIDLFGLSWIKPGNAILKSFLLISAALWVLILFIHSRRKALCTLLIFGFFILAWPSFLITHQARYLYVGMPFFLATIALCINQVDLESLTERVLKFSGFVFFVLTAVIGIFENRQLLSHALERFSLTRNALYDLANRENLFDQTIFFIGLPHEIFPFSGLEQALSIFGPEKYRDRKVIYEPLLNATCFFVNRIENKVPTENLLKMEVDGNECGLESLNREKIWINYSNPFGYTKKCSVGDIIKISIYSDQDQHGLRVSRILVSLNDQVIEQMPVFITWDYQNQRFIEV